MEPGDALFFHSNLLHASDQNKVCACAERIRDCGITISTSACFWIGDRFEFRPLTASLPKDVKNCSC